MTIKVSAPGKVILTGEHAVVLGRKSVATSLSLRTSITFVPTTEPILAINLPDLGVDESWNLSSIYNASTEVFDPQVPVPCSQELFDSLQKLTKHESKGVVAILFLFYALSKSTKQEGGWKVMLKSELPMGAGLGSSAAFCVCIAAGILQVNKIFANGAKQDSITEPCEKQKDLINLWSLQGEKIMHGNPSGIDNAVATFGSALSFTKKDGFKTIRRIPTLRLLITDTKVSRQTKKLVESVILRQQKFAVLIDPVLDLINTISNELLQSFEDYFLRTETDPSTTNKELDHMYEKLELMIDLNHHLLTGGLGVGHASLDNIQKITREFGFHSKLTGAGGGGCAITLVPKDATEQKVQEVKKALEGAGYSCWEAKIGGPGVLFHIDDSAKL
eukprot:Phypoly_transcript_02940.p2 GENE.Phypoly_transcript_02940~~Phypoly_transcript_02940.p2  ORF type:complete len:389 (-),score=58.97 Phypoly_transcript_02940:16-1182(-)